MKRLIFSLSVVIIGLTFFSSPVQAQDVLDGIYEKEHVPARKPIPYHHLREADVMWKKKIWRVLNLREKINHPLYYPTTVMDDRYSLMNLISWGIENEGMIVYGTDDDEFTAPLTITEVQVNLGASIDTTFVEDLETGELIPKVVNNEPSPEQVERFMMKEVWFFDKQRSKLEVRIVGLCPIRRFIKEVEGAEDQEGGELISKLVCWVYYPAARSMFANHEVFNTNNDAERRTFEDIFFKRRFSSYIYQETNVYDNRRVNLYKQGLDALLEGEKIKEFMFKMEHDLWEY